MAIEMTGYSLTGTLITDEIVVCDESIGSGLYKGYFNYYPNANIQGNTSTIYKVCSAPSGAGTRYIADITGNPITGRCKIDLNNATVISPSALTYYVTYLGHGPVIHNNLTPLCFDFSNKVLENGVSYTLATRTFPKFVKFNYANVEICSDGINPTATTTITLSNGTQTQAITVATTGENHTTEFSPLKVTTAQTLTVSTTDGNDLTGFRIVLYDC